MKRTGQRAAGSHPKRATAGRTRSLTGMAAVLAMVAVCAIVGPAALGGSASRATGENASHGVKGYEAGTYNWVAPTGVTSVEVELWAGGGGGGCPPEGGVGKGGGGGGAGGYLRAVVQVTPGQAYTLVVSDSADECSDLDLHPAEQGGRTALLLNKAVLAGAFGGAPGTQGTLTFQGQGGLGGNTSPTPSLGVRWSGVPGQNAFGKGYAGDGGKPTPGSLGRGFGAGGAGGGRTYVPYALDSALRQPATFGARGYAILTW